MATRTGAEGAKNKEQCAARAGRKNEVWTREGGWKDGERHGVAILRSANSTVEYSMCEAGVMKGGWCVLFLILDASVCVSWRWRFAIFVVVCMIVVCCAGVCVCVFSYVC